MAEGGRPHAEGRGLSAAPRTVLLLGATGRAGHPLAGLIARRGEGRVGRLILASRSAERARRLVSELTPAATMPLEALALDPADPAALAEALDPDVVVVDAAAGPAAGRAVLDACVDRGRPLLSLNGRVGASVHPMVPPTIPVLTQAGAVPGLPGVLVRRAAERMATLETVELACRLGGGLGAGGAADMVAAAEAAGTVYRHGEPCRRPLWLRRRLNVGSDGARLPCVPLDLPELRAVAAVTGAERLALWLGGFGTGGDARLYLARRARPGGVLARWLASGLQRATAHTAEGFTLTLEARGQDAAGRPATLGLRLASPDTYGATAAAACAGLWQLLDGSVRAGAEPMGMGVAPARLLDDLRDLGMTVLESG